MVIIDSVYDATIAALQAGQAQLLSAAEKQQLRERLWQQGKLNPQLIAKSAAHILNAVGIPHADDVSVIMVAEDSITPSNPFCNEKLSPVLSVFRANDFDHAIKIITAIYDINGKGHSVGMHSNNQQHILRLGLELPVCRVIVNQAHCFATGGSFDNGLPFSLSMGCGTWGNNVISDNMNYRHYINTTRIVRPIKADQPPLAELFGAFWQKHNIKPQ